MAGVAASCLAVVAAARAPTGRDRRAARRGRDRLEWKPMPARGGSSSRTRGSPTPCGERPSGRRDCRRFVGLLWTARSPGGHAASARRSHVMCGGEAGGYGVPDETFLRRRLRAGGRRGGTCARRELDPATLAHLAGGRHAPGVRQLRQAIGGLARRDAWTDAAGGAVVLVSSLLRRGRVRAAQAAMEDARQYASRAGRDPLLLDLATLSGEAWIALARLDEAESVLGRGRRRAGRATGAIVTAAMALARCPSGAVAAGADAALGSSGGRAGAVRARHSLLAARVAVGQRARSRAVALAEICHEAGRTATPASGGAACTAARPPDRRRPRHRRARRVRVNRSASRPRSASGRPSPPAAS